jgi:hypothetical protein
MIRNNNKVKNHTLLILKLLVECPYDAGATQAPTGLS